jgi:hypothetical protein
VQKRIELQRFHLALQVALELALGQEVPVLNGATISGNRTVVELKAEQKILEVKNELDILREQREGLRDDLRGLQATIMTEQEINALKGKKTLTGALKGVTYEEFKSLQKTASHVKRVRAERDREKARADAAEKQVAKVEEMAKQALTRSPSWEMRTKNSSLQTRLERMEK